MFSEKDSVLAVKHKQLWQAFLGRYVYIVFVVCSYCICRFNDISVAIRQKCVQYTTHFLTNHAGRSGRGSSSASRSNTSRRS